MMAGFPSLLLMWLLPLMASNTPMPFYNFTNVTTKPQHELTTKGARSQKQFSEEEIGSNSSLQTTQTNRFRSSFESKTSTSPNTYMSRTNNLTPGVQTTAMRTTATIKIQEASTMESNSTHSTGDGSTNGAIHTTQVNRSPFTGEDVAAELTSPSQYLVSTQVVDITTKKQPSQTGNKPHHKMNHSKTIAGIICGTLALMVVGFVLIYIKKRKMQKGQVTTNDWAGPSPFLDSEERNSQTALQSSNRISLIRFLPQRLSKRLSLLPEAKEDWENVNLGSTFGQEVDSDKPHDVAEIKPSGHTVDAGINVTSEIQTNKPTNL